MKAGGRVGELGRIELKKIRAQQLFEEGTVEPLEMAERLAVHIKTINRWKTAWRQEQRSPSQCGS